jgi:GrpB-like predicted nucleotidyltransferase (UPF0157 family)
VRGFLGLATVSWIRRLFSRSGGWAVESFSRHARSFTPLEGFLLNNQDYFDDGYGQAGDQIRLMHHDARWHQEFEQTRSSILQSCEGRVVAVDHIGSTAIGGLIARPIIDAVAVVADPVDLADSSMLIEGLNFRSIEMPDWAKRWTPATGAARARLLEKPRHGETTHRIYVVGQGSQLAERTIRLRQFLQSNPEVAIELEERKVEIWKSCDGTESSYHAAMSSVFDDFDRRLGPAS